MKPELWILLAFTVMVLSVSAAYDVKKTRTAVETIMVWVEAFSDWIVLGLGILFIGVAS